MELERKDGTKVIGSPEELARYEQYREALRLPEIQEVRPRKLIPEEVKRRKPRKKKMGKVISFQKLLGKKYREKIVETLESGVTKQVVAKEIYKEIRPYTYLSKKKLHYRIMDIINIAIKYVRHTDTAVI
jgi:hypothetical protein